MRREGNMKEIIPSWIGTGIAWLANIVDTNPIAQWVAFAVSCLASVFSLVYTGLKVAPLIVQYFSKFKCAIKDGKIDEEELKELNSKAEEIKDEVERNGK